MKVLVVEDDPDLREIYSAVIDRLGGEALPAESVKQAYEILESRKDLNIGLVDFFVPGFVQGFARGRGPLATKLKEIPNFCFAFVSGSATLTEEEAKLNGACCLVAKPVTSGELETVLRTMYERSQAH